MAPTKAATPWPISGDFNHDGTARAADYVIWRKNPGGIYTQVDFNAWRANFGATLNTGSSSALPLPPSPFDATMPEPTSFALALLGVVGVLITPRDRVAAKNRC